MLSISLPADAAAPKRCVLDPTRWGGAHKEKGNCFPLPLIKPPAQK